MGKNAFLAIGILAAATTNAQSALPELKVHFDYANRAVTARQWNAVAATAQVLAPNRITFFLDPQSVDEDVRKAFAEATSAWEVALDGTLKFEQVPYALEANLVIIGTDRMAIKKQNAAGYTFWNRGLNPDFTPHLTAQVLLARFAAKQTLSPEARKHAAMHELGHILGLDDSKHVGDVMGPLDLRNPVREPRFAEVSVLKQIRRDAEVLAAQSRRGIFEKRALRFR
jgi:hypothetical protein